MQGQFVVGNTHIEAAFSRYSFTKYVFRVFSQLYTQCKLPNPIHLTGGVAAVLFLLVVVGVIAGARVKEEEE